MPVRRGSCQSRDLQAEDRTDASEAHLTREPLEPSAVRCSGAALTQVIIDNLHSAFVPAEILRLRRQIVLSLRRLSVVDDLCLRRLPDVDERVSRKMLRAYLHDRHDRPPAFVVPRARLRPLCESGSTGATEGPPGPALSSPGKESLAVADGRSPSGRSIGDGSGLSTFLSSRSRTRAQRTASPAGWSLGCRPPRVRSGRSGGCRSVHDSGICAGYPSGNTTSSPRRKPLHFSARTRKQRPNSGCPARVTVTREGVVVDGS